MSLPPKPTGFESFQLTYGKCIHCSSVYWRLPNGRCTNCHRNGTTYTHPAIPATVPYAPVATNTTTTSSSSLPEKPEGFSTYQLTYGKCPACNKVYWRLPNGRCTNCHRNGTTYTHPATYAPVATNTTTTTSSSTLPPKPTGFESFQLTYGKCVHCSSVYWRLSNGRCTDCNRPSQFINPPALGAPSLLQNVREFFSSSTSTTSTSTSNTSSTSSFRSGFAYCITNPSYPGLVMVGVTNAAGKVQETLRAANQLTSLPYFEIAFVKRVANVTEARLTIHSELSAVASLEYPFGDSPLNGDFFRTDVDTVRDIFDRIDFGGTDLYVSPKQFLHREEYDVDD